MLRTTSAFAFVSAVALSLGLAFAPVRAPQPLVGPGAVMETQKSLLAAIDSGDGRAAAALVVPESDDPVSMLLIDLSGKPVAAHGIEDSAALFTSLANASRKAGGTFKSTILSSDATCPSEHLSWIAMEYETTHTQGDATTTRRFGATSIVRWTKDGPRFVRMQVTEIPLQPAR
jgi:hypothetical protein